MIDRPSRARFLAAATGLWLLMSPAALRAVDVLPPTPLPLFEGGTLSLRSLVGRVIVIRFAASWRPYCQREFPVFEQVWQRYKDRNIAFVNIFVDDTEAKAREFLKTRPVSFPSGYDWQHALANPLGFRGMPYVVVISPSGQVAPRFIGPVTSSDLAGEIDKLLATR